MSASTALETELTSDPRGLAKIRARVGAWAEGLGWSDRQVGEIVLALDEAVTNVIRHSYNDDPRQRILVSADMIDDPDHGEGVEIRVRDFGRQVDPTLIHGRDLDVVRPGGLGVHIMRAMTSTIEYQPAEGGGTLLIMRKYRTHTAQCGGRPRDGE